MLSSKVLNAVDTHTAGEPTRIILSGYPYIHGKSMTEKTIILKEKYDHLRKILMFEPRGHKDMVGAVLTDSIIEEADMGVIFMDCWGYLYMCGSGMIGVATTVVELGLVNPIEPFTVIKFDTRAGLVEAKVNVKNGRAVNVTFQNVPSFNLFSDIEMDLPEVGSLRVDVSYGGNFFGQVDMNQLDIRIEPNNLDKLIEYHNFIKKAVAKKVKVEHPQLKHVKGLDHTMFYKVKSENPMHVKNVVIVGDNQVDRSPCGTGTSALMAMLHKKGILKVNQELKNESIIGTVFKGRLKDVIENFSVIPEITGSAYITGLNQIIVDPEDPLRKGFLL